MSLAHFSALKQLNKYIYIAMIGGVRERDFKKNPVVTYSRGAGSTISFENPKSRNLLNECINALQVIPSFLMVITQITRSQLSLIVYICSCHT
jgi:hypothetical protein